MNPAQVHQRLDTDLQFFAEHANIVVKDKQGVLVPFRLNTAQRYIHDCLEKQKAAKGWVRALLLKGRQQGGSTYIEARFFHQVMRRSGISAFILSHESKTTDKLFNMVRRFYENMLDVFKPTLGKDNPREMTFPGLNADYAAGTAGNEQVGRGGTAQLFHGSEPAYWEKAYAIQDGALKSIALLPGTEIILESTANGPVGLFYEKCKQALRQIGDYLLIFVPWFWQEEYEREPESDFELTDEEFKFAAANFAKPFPYHPAPITPEQIIRKLAWRRAEIVDLSTGQNPDSGHAKFRSIYPSNPIEAFLSTAVGIIRPDAITAARAQFHVPSIDEFAPRLLGVDPAGDGKKSDRTILALRQGRRVEQILKYPKMRPMELAGIIAKLITQERLDMVFIDRGYGEGTIDRLRELRFGQQVIGVAFNERPLSPIYTNKRSEIIIECAKWLNAGDGVAVPDDDDVHADLAAMPLDKESSNGVKYMPPKEEIIKVLGRSPDIFDAIALTFAYPVRRADADMRGANTWQKVERAGGVGRRAGPLSSLNRRRRIGS